MSQQQAITFQQHEDVSLVKLKKFQHNGNDVVEGDLHANAVRLLWSLISNGILPLDKTAYREIYDYFSENLPQASLDWRFGYTGKQQDFIVTDQGVKAYIAKTQAALPKGIDMLRGILKLDEKEVLQAKDTQRSFTLIGDIIADRGASDVAIFTVLEWMHKAGVDYSIIFSNHDAIALSVYSALLSDDFNLDAALTSNPLFTDLMSGRSQQQISLSTTVKRLADMKQAERKKAVAKLKKQFTECYLRKLKLVDYAFTEDGTIILKTHATVPYSSLKQMAELMDLEWKDGTDKDLAGSIDALNDAFIQKNYYKYVGNDQLAAHSITEEQTVERQRAYLNAVKYIDAFVKHDEDETRRCLAGADLNEDLPERLVGRLAFVHGHVGESSRKVRKITNPKGARYYSTDTDFGKHDDPLFNEHRAVVQCSIAGRKQPYENIPKVFPHLKVDPEEKGQKQAEVPTALKSMETLLQKSFERTSAQYKGAVFQLLVNRPELVKRWDKASDIGQRASLAFSVVAATKSPEAFVKRFEQRLAADEKDRDKIRDFLEQVDPAKKGGASTKVGAKILHEGIQKIWQAHGPEKALNAVNLLDALTKQIGKARIMQRKPAVLKYLVAQLRGAPMPTIEKLKQTIAAGKEFKNKLDGIHSENLSGEFNTICKKHGPTVALKVLSFLTAKIVKDYEACTKVTKNHIVRIIAEEAERLSKETEQKANLQSVKKAIKNDIAFRQGVDISSLERDDWRAIREYLKDGEQETAILYVKNQIKDRESKKYLDRYESEKTWSAAIYVAWNMFAATSVVSLLFAFKTTLLTNTFCTLFFCAGLLNPIVLLLIAAIVFITVLSAVCENILIQDFLPPEAQYQFTNRAYMALRVLATTLGAAVGVIVGCVVVAALCANPVTGVLVVATFVSAFVFAVLGYAVGAVATRLFAPKVDTAPKTPGLFQASPEIGALGSKGAESAQSVRKTPTLGSEG